MSHNERNVRVLGIVCSPRNDGNTQTLVRKVLDSAEKEGATTEMWTFINKTIQPCNHCGSCIQTGECTIDDDMQELYRKMIEADGIVFGSPVYYFSVSAQAKLVIDRTYAFRRPIWKLRGKVGGAVAVAGRRGQVSTLMVINNFFSSHGVLLPSLGVEGRASGKGDIKNDERALTDATALGTEMVQLIVRLKKTL